MTAELRHFKDLLSPGLLCVETRYPFVIADWQGIFGNYETTMAAPHIWVPKLTLPEMAALGAAAAIIKNPIVTRRFWSGWNL